MGMYDDVTFDYVLPEGMLPPDRTFQTKSLYRIMDRFTITKDGRLIHHPRRYVQDASQQDSFPMMRLVDQEDIDMEFHGDVYLSGILGENFADYVVRFTHGTLEWIRPVEALSDHVVSLALRTNLED
jgi:hypothetical protein